MGEEHFVDVDVREAIEAGVIAGPRLLVGRPRPGRQQRARTRAGELRRGRRRPPRRPRKSAPRRQPREDLRDGRRELARPTPTASAYTREEIRAAVEEADRVGTYAAAHAHGGPGLQLAVREGVRTIEHGRWPPTKTSR